MLSMRQPQVIVQTPGTLYELLPAGVRVEVGDALARLGNDQLALEVIELAGDVSYCRALLQNAELQAVIRRITNFLPSSKNRW